MVRANGLLPRKIVDAGFDKTKAASGPVLPARQNGLRQREVEIGTIVRQAKRTVTECREIFSSSPFDFKDASDAFSAGTKISFVPCAVHTSIKKNDVPESADMACIAHDMDSASALRNIQGMRSISSIVPACASSAWRHYSYADMHHSN